MVQTILSLLVRSFFYKATAIEYSEDEIQEFDLMFDSAILSPNLTINYESSYPKSRFLRYISDTRDILLHGSNNKTIETFEPRQQTLYNGKMTEAVFASKDGIWPVFYAVLDRQKVEGGFRNGSIKIKKSEHKYHFYSINKATSIKHPWTSGMVYCLPDVTFEKASQSKLSFEEWTSQLPVKPIVKLEVNPSDFIFLDRVSVHKDNESRLRTWLFYKLRTKYIKQKKV